MVRGRGTIGCRPFYFIFKNVLFFIYCTEQTTKGIIWLKRCYFFIKTRRSILKWYDSTAYLRQPSSSNNRLAPKSSVKGFWLIPLFFSYEFCEISKNTFLKNTSCGCFCIKWLQENLFFLHSFDKKFLCYKILNKPWLGFLAA